MKVSPYSIPKKEVFWIPKSTPMPFWPDFRLKIKLGKAKINLAKLNKDNNRRKVRRINMDQTASTTVKDTTIKAACLAKKTTS
jgi:hypothetical protein